MAKSATIRARIEPSLKEEVEHLFNHLGLSVTSAINLFYRQVKLRKGLPFDVEILNAKTRKTFEKTDKGKELIRYKNLDQLSKL
ncbi:MAG: type II toxin-antitoxin system RelB/DinJ family antitoxin [Verrucomicrobiota bacterium]